MSRKRRPTRLFTIGGYDYVVPNPRRLAVISVALIAVVVAGLFVFLPRGEKAGIPAEAAAAPCYQGCGTAQATPYPRVLTPGSVEEASFRAAAKGATSDDAFYSGYSRNLGVPAHFYAYIPPESTTTDPDYFEADGMVYVPAALLPAGDPGGFDATVARDEGRVIILGFDRAQKPAGQFVEVWGYLQWNSLQMNPRATNLFPVFAVESVEPVSPSAVRQPASRVYPQPGSAAAEQPLLVVRRDDLRLTVDSVEFTPDQTRVHISVINLGTGASAAWDYSRATLLTANGQIPLLSFTSGGGNPAEEAPTDGLRSEELPPGGLQDSSVRREGYLFFGPTDPNRAIKLSLPDLNGTAGISSAAGGDFIRLDIPAPAATTS